MIVQGVYKLIVYAPVQPGNTPWPSQLFNIAEDPWERDNLATKIPELTARLRMLLEGVINTTKADATCKDWNKYMFTRFWYNQTGGASNCLKAMKNVYDGFDASSDGPLVEKWLGLPCN
eukprot:m.46474 g.46474  ORF g.46474 m.46474 type:complete len:119 (+) comp10375_c0_seq2:199-555(+)